MHLSDECVICNSKNLKKYSSIISPFLAERIWGIKSFPVKLFWCQNCDFMFYNLRPNDDEMSRLYKGYRNDEYQKQREKYEKCYTQEFNLLLSGDSSQTNRKIASYHVIKNNLDLNNVESILDYGGDKGQFIIDELQHADRFVYDISKVDPVPGVHIINDISESQSHKFDFITCSMVLEHVSYPLDVLSNLKKFAHDKSIFYFEVPLGESPKKFFCLLRRFPLACDMLYSAIHKNLTMHEHMNFFSKLSLRYMLEKEHFNLLFLGNVIVDHGGAKGNILYCMASCSDIP